MQIFYVIVIFLYPVYDARIESQYCFHTYRLALLFINFTDYSMIHDYYDITPQYHYLI